MHEELLAVIPLRGETRGEDFYAAIKALFAKEVINLTKVTSVTTDGCPSMRRKVKGFVSLWKKEYPSVISFHCILHQETLSASFKDNR